MERNEIKAHLAMKGVTVTSIANGLGIAIPSVSQVISRAKNTRRVQKAIAKAIGKPVDEVFPEPTKEAA